MMNLKAQRTLSYCLVLPLLILAVMFLYSRLNHGPTAFSFVPVGVIAIGVLISLLILMARWISVNTQSYILELEQQVQLKNILLDNLAEGVVACDENGILSLFNRTARDWHASEPRDTHGQQWSQYYNWFESDGLTPLDVHNNPLLRALRGEHVWDARIAIVGKDQAIRYLSVNGAAVHDKLGLQLGAVVALHDITAHQGGISILRELGEQCEAGHEMLQGNSLVESEEAISSQVIEEPAESLSLINKKLALAKAKADQANVAKSEFLAAMSHEIRTPMNGVLGMLEVLMLTQLDAEQQNAVNIINESALSLLTLIDDILDFSKIEAEKLKLEHIPVSLRDLVQDVCTSLKPLAERKRIDLQLFVAPQVPNHILSDPTRLRQVFYNLIGNGIKFCDGSQDGRGKVNVRITVASNKPLILAISIQDNGIGIAPEQLKSLQGR